jgi:hypothetical protein
LSSISPIVSSGYTGTISSTPSAAGYFFGAAE